MHACNRACFFPPLFLILVQLLEGVSTNYSPALAPSWAPTTCQALQQGELGQLGRSPSSAGDRQPDVVEEPECQP